MEFRAIQHETILKAMESDPDLSDSDKNHLARCKALLQSDLWTVQCRLQDRRDDSQLLADQERLERAIGRIESRLEAL